MKKLMEVKKRLFSVVLALVVALGCIPVGTESVKAAVPIITTSYKYSGCKSVELEAVAVGVTKQISLLTSSTALSYDSDNEILSVYLGKLSHSEVCGFMGAVSAETISMTFTEKTTSAGINPPGVEAASVGLTSDSDTDTSHTVYLNISSMDTVENAPGYPKINGKYCTSIDCSLSGTKPSDVKLVRIYFNSQHTYHTTTTQPTCTDAGKVTYACTDYSYYETLPAKGHSFEVESTTASTCSTVGNRHYVCTVCGATKDEVIDKKAHTPSRTKTYLKSAATCEDDTVYYEECTVCHEKLDSEWTDEGTASGHVYEETPSFKFADDGKSCTAVYKCKDCGEEKTVGCNISFKLKIAPTCTERGVTTYTATATHPVTGAKSTDTKDVANVDAKGHSFTDTVIAPSISEKGYTLHVCDVCGHEERDNFTEKITVADGTTGFSEDNNLAGKESDGYKIYLQNVYITFTGSDGKEHKISVYEAGTDTTLINEGAITIHYVTTDDTGKETEKTETLKVAELEDGITIEGDKMYFTFETSTGENIISQEYHKASKDTNINGISVKGVAAELNDDIYSCKLPCDTDLKSICKEDFKIDGAEGASISNVIQNADGTWTLCIVAEDTGYTQNYTVDIVKKAHEYQDTVVTPTCVDDGYTKHVCSVCGDSYIDSVVNATGHKESDWIVDKYPTETEYGEQHKECVICGKVLAEKLMPKVMDAQNSGETTTGSEENPGDTGAETGTVSESSIKVGSIFTIGGIKYKVTSNSKGKESVSVVGLKSKKTTKVAVKDTVKINGVKCKVTAISNNAFKTAKKLKTVSLGNNIASIGNSAFYGCTSLTKVTIGKGVKSIGSKAFYGCKKLKTMKISSTQLKKVGKSALKGVDSRMTIKVPEKKVKAYKKLFKTSTGYKKTMKITK